MRRKPPTDDQLEVTVLGRGVGECIVVHLLNGDWMIVDSFNQAKQPAARRYLDSMGVKRDQVKVIVITHFDSDHYRGVADLHDHYPQARLMPTAALAEDHFRSIYADTNPEPALSWLPQTIKLAAARRISPSISGLRWISAGTEVYNVHGTTVKALSPTDVAIQESNRQLGEALKTGQRHDVVNHLSDDNRCSVVLSINTVESNVLLCGDLLADRPEYGWQAVVQEPNNKDLPRADFVKVPHHGSSGADDPDMWSTLVEPKPQLAVAPYWSSKIPLPTDVERLNQIGRQLWQAAPSAQTQTDEFGNSIVQPIATGIVRAQRKPGAKRWTVRATKPAFAAHK